MATAKEFVTHVAKVNGVAGCLLVRNDGVLLGQTLDDPEIYSTLMVIGGNLAGEVKEKVGFSACRHLSFGLQSRNHFHVFPIDKYLLGIVQHSDCSIPDMLDAISRLISRVSTNRSTVDINGS
jgi:hypothetical protein